MHAGADADAASDGFLSASGGATLVRDRARARSSGRQVPPQTPEPLGPHLHQQFPPSRTSITVSIRWIARSTSVALLTPAVNNDQMIASYALAAALKRQGNPHESFLTRLQILQAVEFKSLLGVGFTSSVINPRGPALRWMP